MAIMALALFVGVVSAQRSRTPAASERSVTVTSEPDAKVWINGVLYGKTGKFGSLTIKSVSAGTHTVKVRADGFKERSQSLSATQRGNISVPLVKTSDEAELAFQSGERLSTQDRDKAAEAYRRAVKLRPSYVDAYVGLARVLLDAGDVEGATEAIAAARRIKPGSAEVSAVEGRVFKEDGEEQKAIAAFKRAIVEGKGFQPEAYAGLGLLYKEKAEGSAAGGDLEAADTSYAEAAKNLRMSIKQLSGAPDAAVIYQLLGLIYEHQKKFSDAIALYREFLRLFPDSPEATAVQSFIVQLQKNQNSPE